jgi:dTDP-glucose pyrophosphorylase/CBS domain-containing protein
MNRHRAESRLKKVIISPQTLISEVIPVLDQAGMGILLLCDDDRRLVGIITDGDIRRAMLQGHSFTKPCISIANQRPFVAQASVTSVEALYLMDHGLDFVMNHLPIVDSDGRVVDLILRWDLTSETQIPMSAVVMAGGFGARLRPLTDELPKPMLPVGDRPLLELIVERLQKAGIRTVNITTHYKPEKITEHFGDGQEFGVHINYVSENRPLGTAGALSLLEKTDQPLLVVNGDILTRVDFRAMLTYHREYKADMTVAVRRYDIKVPYGVLDCEGHQVRQVHEKPVYEVFVNAGIYLLQPEVQRYIPTDQHFDMTELIECLLTKGCSVVSFPLVEYWLDIGQHSDYLQAQEDVKNRRFES